VTKLRRRRFQLYRTASIVDQRSPEHPAATKAEAAADGVASSSVTEVTVSFNDEDAMRQKATTIASTGAESMPPPHSAAAATTTVSQ
jgi:hypothetical protein